MQQLLMTSMLILCLLIIYLTMVASEQGLQTQQRHAHEHTTNYVRDIDA